MLILDGASVPADKVADAFTWLLGVSLALNSFFLRGVASEVKELRGAREAEMQARELLAREVAELRVRQETSETIVALRAQLAARGAPNTPER